MFVYKIYVENDIIVKTEVAGVDYEPQIYEPYQSNHQEDFSDLSYYEAMATQILESQIYDASSMDIDLTY